VTPRGVRSRERDTSFGKTEPQEVMPGDVGLPGARPVTSFLFLRYRLQSFKVGAEVPNQALNVIRHLMADSSSN
jgi:hypothetical protein